MPPLVSTAATRDNKEVLLFSRILAAGGARLGLADWTDKFFFYCLQIGFGKHLCKTNSHLHTEDDNCLLRRHIWM